MHLVQLPTAVFAVLAATGCGWLFGGSHPTGFAAIVRARATTPDGAPVASGCESGTSMSGLPGNVRSLGARVLRVPDQPGRQLRVTLRFRNVESELPDGMDPDDDRPFCDASYITEERARALPSGCHAALRVVGADPPAEITEISPIVESGEEVGFVLDVTLRHAGVLRVRSGPPCPLRDEYDLLTIGEPAPEPTGTGGTTSILAR